MMTGFFFISPLPPGSLVPSLLLLVLSSSVLVESKPLSQGLNSRILHDLFKMDDEAGRSSVHGEGSAEAVMSSVRHRRNELNEADPLLPHATERGAEPARVWPHLLLDLMGQQNKFKGRTRKNVRGSDAQEERGR
ncbi:hypothetical protein KOW79_022245 [Hemibagrus wyckioides]|uniref:Uncharacterized protein n=1 Tax=Hemibagrus wyckioides TaxID=337641 RepID=A0A9D3N5U3_9TELE|nr:hypothetical protein KOW79_022245 [Hemibagrus wyckioides]